ncbi:MAG: response regulator [Proteobacteria bacterium]|nr:response regulator [Pseudomonadota bacterium]
MAEGQPRVYFISGPNPCSDRLSAQLETLKDRCQSALTKLPGNATYIIGLGDIETWPNVEVPSTTSQIVYVWFEEFAQGKIYETVIDHWNRVTFLHGSQGLIELAALLEAGGVLHAEFKSDPLAEDVFFRLKGDYLRQLEDELEHTPAKTAKSSSARIEDWEKLLRRIAGSAGTYEFEVLSRIATNSLKGFSKAKLPAAAEKELRRNLQNAVSEELETYRRQVEECLPTLVELDVRQRVLVLVDDTQIANQLGFALSHSRIQTAFYDNPAEILSALHSVQPDILVVQQAMRYFDGLDLASYVRNMERFESLPILALLKESTEETLTRATRGGVDSWLTIPFSAANVALAVLNLLRRVEVARKLGGRDPLTGLYTKEAMVDRLQGDLARVGRSGQQIAVMLIHITNTDSPRLAFLDITDTANRVFRRSDLLSRYNEATLAVVLPGIDTRTIVSVISRFHLLLDNNQTVEIAATISDGTASPESLLADVEMRLTHVLSGTADAAVGLLETEPTRETLRAVPKILIADNDEAIVNLLRFFCAREGFEVDDVRTGTDTVDYLEKAREEDTLPDIIVLESFLPGVDGFQVLEKVQEDFGSRIAVIMLSVSPSEERVSQAFKLGAIDFISKPFRVPEIIARIRNGLVRTCAV